MGRHILRQFIAISFFSVSLWCQTNDDNSILPSQNPLPFRAGTLAESTQLPEAQGLLASSAFSNEFGASEQIQKYITYFQKPDGLSWLADGMSHAQPFRDFIVAYLSERNMPPELYFVVMIESSFHIEAISRSGAAGLWQFMRNSMGAMRHNEWLDERFDFWQSTKAAIDKLQENYDEFGDWLLALAAYNAGSGRIERLIKKVGTRDFWELAQSRYMPRETKAYVPQILAAAYVGSHPGRYGLPVTWNEQVQWQRIPVNTTIALRNLSENADIPLKILELGNAELRYGITPPGQRTHYIKVPVQYSQAALDALQDQKPQLDYIVHKVGKGDTLYAISRNYGSKNSLILEYNPNLNPNRLQIGQKLIIPLLQTTKSAEKSSKDRQ